MPKKTMPKWIIVIVCVAFYALIPNSLYAFISFPDADLNGSNGLLFTAKITSGEQTWENLYETTVTQDKDAVQAAAENPRLLTCFPQRIDSFQGGKFLQIRNADGIFMYASSRQTLERLSENPILYPSPASDARARDNLTETAISPDGNWLCYFKKTSPAMGTLMLSSTKTGEELTLARNTDFSFQSLPVRWAPDSSVLIYEKEDNLYFIEPDNAFSFSGVDEEFRQIGEGSISSIMWASEKMLVYIQNDIVFTISVNELYTRALYSSVLGSGEIAGRLPWAFDSNTDRFWTDETGMQIVMIQGGNTLFYFELLNTRSTIIDGVESKELVTTPFAQTLYSHAFLPISGSALDCTVLWIPSATEDFIPSASTPSAPSIPLLWLEYSGSTNQSYVYRLNKVSQNGGYFEQLNVPQKASSPSLSNDKKLVAFTALSSTSSDTAENTARSLYLYDLESWQQQYVFFEEPVVSFAWKTNTSLFVGGSQTVRTWNFTSQNSDVLFLSSVNRFAWDETGTKILASCNAGTFEYNATQNIWASATSAITRQNNAMNSHWRIISNEGRNNNYENILFVRALQGESWTKPLLWEFLDTADNRATVTLAFDALDNQDGLAHILSVLSDYGLTGSFFINGEFLRRFPEAVLSIFEAGHESAPMFYTTADLLSDDFIIDENFIRRGLANNEDEFFALTRSDMELFWHTPYYRTSALIEDAGNAAGYTLLSDVIRFNDTMTLESAAEQGIPYVSSSNAIEDIVSRLFDGAVIPISVGIGDGSRPDYMYEKLDVLINAIYEAGYAIAPISEVIY